MSEQAADGGSLTDLVERFLRADEALEFVVDERARLAAASKELAQARTHMDVRTQSSVDALEQLRAQLRERMDAEADYAEAVQQHEGAVTELLHEVTALLTQLREIDPARFAREIDELRRDSADNASEVREVRRVIADLERHHAALVAEARSTSQMLEQVVRDHEAIRQVLQAQSARFDHVDAAHGEHAAALWSAEGVAAERHREVLDAFRRTQRGVIAAVVLGGLSLVVSVAALFVG
ncbi:MAG: hypothetical protein F2534_20410 [Actinobacteria bacterium]|uniref:Unannotated protein n=1 Tax=freshwater metagenome TaxID=449393 RepID=A0A6J6GDI7_9ZZZZ|nr:hypothetical protein [Actinomycetota bacterium]